MPPIVETPTSVALITERSDICADLLPLHAKNPQRYPYFLESVAKGAAISRYDILFACPQRQITLNTACLGESDFLTEFDHGWSEESLATTTPLPFKGGWFVFLGYEVAQQIEPSLQFSSEKGDTFPVAIATRIPCAIIVDHLDQCSYFIAEEAYAHWLPSMQEDFASITSDSTLVENQSMELIDIVEEEPERFLDGVNKIKDYIVNGDVFQVNLSRSWRARFNDGVNGAELYRRLRQANPAPFAGLLYHQGNYIISSSPERLVSVNEDFVETRPIAGTRPRGEGVEQDAQLSNALLNHPKEIAEHIMLIDLERNDLGRICQPGTVEVNELMGLESYRHVHHIVSNVRGKLRDGITPGQVIRAVFPGGTITGCPKVRCMEIIAELEQERRGAYTGAMGYINHDGSLDLNILIRTLTLSGNEVVLRAGAGIVADSNPEMELAETRAKARGLLRALQNQLD